MLPCMGGAGVAEDAGIWSDEATGGVLVRSNFVLSESPRWQSKGSSWFRVARSHPSSPSTTRKVGRDCARRAEAAFNK